MHVHMHRLSLVCLKGGIRALETQSRFWTKHALRHGGREGIREYVFKDIVSIHHGILLDVPRSLAEIMMSGRASIQGFSFGDHAGVQQIYLCSEYRVLMEG
jgi:hypothetical protein